MRQSGQETNAIKDTNLLIMVPRRGRCARPYKTTQRGAWANLEVEDTGRVHGQEPWLWCPQEEQARQRSFNVNIFSGFTV